MNRFFNTSIGVVLSNSNKMSVDNVDLNLIYQFSRKNYKIIKFYLITLIFVFS